jgi:dCTP deaminase
MLALRKEHPLMILSDRDIVKRCQVVRGTFWSRIQEPMIWPFVDRKVIHPCGFSYGLSGASYDLRIRERVYLPPNPIYRLQELLQNYGRFQTDFAVQKWHDELHTYPRSSQLAHTLEQLAIPDDVCAFVVDKSSYARRFVSALNTLFDPGFKGHGVLELVNLGPTPVLIEAGEPVCQMVFHKMASTARPYRGKYYGQTAGNHGARYERPDGSWVTLG